jgi:hypothetical protein
MLVKKAKSIQTRKTLLVVELTNVKDEEPLKMTVLPFWVWSVVIRVKSVSQFVIA